MTVSPARARLCLAAGVVALAASCGEGSHSPAKANGGANSAGATEAGAGHRAVGGTAAPAGAAQAGAAAGAGSPAGAGSDSAGRPTTTPAGGQAGSGGDHAGGEPGEPTFPYSGCVLTGSDPLTLAGEDGGAAGEAAGGARNAPSPVLNGRCENWGTLGCNSQQPLQSLVCDQGKWELFATCVSGESCDPAEGICVEVQPECQAHGAGYAFCDGHELVRCAPDLVSLERGACCGVCNVGSCEAPRCGDGRVTGNEQCDDGNTLAGDGCEPDCAPSRVVALSGGGGHTCALLRGGAVRCWGDNSHGQLGLSSNANVANQLPYELAPVALGAVATALASGSSHTCALLSSGAVRCWGRNNHGQLGLGHTNDIGDNEVPSAKVAEVSLGEIAIGIAAGGNETCAVMKGGSVRCWGGNSFGQLGLGHTNDVGDNESPSAQVAELSLGGTSVSVAVASEHACALFDSGLIRCWGHNDVGQLGLGHTDDIGDDEPPSDSEPIDFRRLESPSLFSLSAGGQRACAGINQGFMQGWMYCWGYNGDGGLGVGLIENRPLQKAGAWGLFSWGSPNEEIVVGATHQCVRLYNHDLHCWGLNDKAQLGLDHLETMGDSENVAIFPPSKFPRSDVDSFAYPVTLSAGEFHTCVVLDTGRVLCWGRNDRGQLGLGFASPGPVDYVGGDVEHTPDKLAPTRVLPSSP